jgi:hypothetical protein
VRYVPIKDGSHQTVEIFFWRPTKVWDCELQQDVVLWLERRKVIRVRLGGRWAQYILWNEQHGRDEEPEFSPEVRRVFRELGIS